MAHRTGSVQKQRPAPGSVDRLQVVADDARLVDHAGMMLAATLADRLGLRRLVETAVNLGSAPGRANAADKVMTLIFSALAGGDCIEDANGIRAGGTGRVLGVVAKAPSTLGTFLRSFRLGSPRQLDSVSRRLLAAAWSAGAGPGDAPLTIDIDSTVCETYGLAKQGAHQHDRNGKRGYHPLVATLPDTGEVVHARLRNGRAHTGRGAAHFLREVVARVRSAGARGALTLRGDSGFYIYDVVKALRSLDVRFSLTVRLSKSLRTHLDAIPEEAWTPIPYWTEGAADVAETTWTPFASVGNTTPVRLIVRRVRPTPGSQLAFLVTYSYHAFITDREGEMLALEADHRRHAEVENVIRDLKYGVGLNHLPSGSFAANEAWLAIQVMAHNLGRWTVRLGLKSESMNTKTLRRRYLAFAGRLTRSGRQETLHLPMDWPWMKGFMVALSRLRALPHPV